MNTLEASLLATELASARTNASLGASHVDQVRRVASINATESGLNLRPLHLALYHFNEAAKLIDQALGKEPTPAAPTIADYIAQARAQVGSVPARQGPPRGLPENVGSTDPVAPAAQAPAEQLSSSPNTKTEYMGSADAPSCEEVNEKGGDVLSNAPSTPTPQANAQQ